MIEKFVQKNYSDKTSLYQHFRESYAESRERPELKEQFGDILTAFLFFKNRERFQKEAYDLEKEKRQIKAVVSLLAGKHVQMGTGEGKTSVVFPIVNVVEALTSDDETSVMVTTDESLLAELETNIDFFTGTLEKSIPGFSLNKESMKEEATPQGLSEELREKMMKETLLTGGYSKKTEEEIRDSYWQDQVNADQSVEKKPKKPSIILATDRDLVFKYQENPNKFYEETGNIYFDEADVPYNRRSPYVKINENQYYSPEEIIDSTADWLRRFIIYKQLEPQNYRPEAGGFTLSNNIKRKLGRLNMSEHLKKYRPGEKSDDQVIGAFQEGIGIIAKKLDLGAEQTNQLSMQLINNHFAFESNEGYLYEDIGEKMAKIYKKKGLLYNLSEHGPQVRDSYIDQFLSDHKFSREDQASILAIEGIFDFVPLNPVAFKTTTFQTFVNHLKDKLRFASGTLMFPDPETKKILPSTFANFLKDATGSDIEIITTPQIKTVPNPEVFESEEETIDRLVGSVKDEGPTLIVSYHIENSQKIFDRLVEKFGKTKVVYIPSKPSDPEALLEYQEKTKQIYRDLAEGKVKIAVSSGAAGFGVNIVKNDDSFPDLRIVLHDLPANRAQLMQILGRRRAEGDNFSWFVSEEFLEPYIMFFDDKVSMMAHALGKLDQIEVKNRLKNAKNNPEQIRKTMLEILKQSEQKEAQGDEIAILFDDLINRLGEKISKELEDKIKNEKPVNEAFFYNYFMGLPEMMKEFITQRSTLITKEARLQDAKSFFTELYSYLLKDSEFSNSATDWYKHREGVLEKHLKTTSEGGNRYFHIPVSPDNILYFFTESVDPRFANINWGFAKVFSGLGKLTDVIAYRKDGQVYLIYDNSGNYLTVSGSNKLENMIKKQTSEKSFHIFNQRYSFLTN